MEKLNAPTIIIGTFIAVVAVIVSVFLFIWIYPPSRAPTRENFAEMTNMEPTVEEGVRNLDADDVQATTDTAETGPESRQVWWRSIRRMILG